MPYKLPIETTVNKLSINKLKENEGLTIGGKGVSQICVQHSSLYLEA
jgi:hypothetical protein